MLYIYHFSVSMYYYIFFVKSKHLCGIIFYIFIDILCLL
nr:MAG TPA: hypothetical protein [Caudoviricetes sp.]